ncbi:MAG: tetratricopeptide repeat protein [Caldilineaceae bacterium]
MTLATSTFGALLRQLRRRAGLTQGQLALLVGFSVAQISRLESNERLPDPTLITEKFLPALALAEEPHLAQRLLELAAAARGEHLPTVLLLRRQVHTLVEETLVEGVTCAEGAEQANDLDPIAAGLPVPLVGRDRDRTIITQRLLAAPGRLLTLIGPPGVGKTQLALAVAADLQPFFTHGVHFVPLAAVGNPVVVASTLVGALGLVEGVTKTPRLRLIEHLRHKVALLILDNFEQVSEAAPLVADLLTECAGLSILVTSQEPLRLRAEQRQRVQPLTPAAAVELFLQRAQAIDPDFAISAEVAAQITAICLRLDCLPLAIELAATQMERFTPAQLLCRLQHEALDLLADGPRDLPARQQTLRNAIQRSYLLLPAQAQAIWRALALFAGGCTLSALAAVLNDVQPTSAPPTASEDVARGLHLLVRKSLAQQQTSEENIRFGLLTTLRDYAQEQLMNRGEIQSWRRAHATYYLTLAQQANCALQYQPQQKWLEQLEQEHDNLRAALQWSLEHAPSMTLQLVAALDLFWSLRGHEHEARRWIDQALASNPAATPCRIPALVTAANVARRQADYVAAQRYMTEALDLLPASPDPIMLAHLLRQDGWLQFDLHRKEPTIARFTASLTLYRQLGDKAAIADLLLCLTHVMIGQPEYQAQVQDYLVESLTLYRELEQPEGVVQVLQQQGKLELMTGCYGAAQAHFQAVAAHWRNLGARRNLAWSIASLGEAAWLQDDLTLATHCYTEAHQLFVELGNKDGEAMVLHHLGAVARRRGDYDRAVHYYRTSMEMNQALANHYMLARCQAGLGAIALTQGMVEQAVALFNGAQTLLAELPPFLAPGDEAELQQWLSHTAPQSNHQSPITPPESRGRQ